MEFNDQKTLVKVATMYYDENMTQAKIAKQLGVSRSLISKYLNDAKDSGIVEIFINSKNLFTARLERKLEKKYNLKNSVVVDTFDLNHESVKKAINRASANFLYNYISTNDTKNIGISWGRSLKGLVDNFEYTNFPGSTVTSLIGGMGMIMYQFIPTN